MLGNFQKTFKKRKGICPPEEVIAEIAKDIPQNFDLVPDEEKGIVLVPKAGEEMNGTFTLSDEAKEVLKNVPKEKWPIYLYRTQKVIDVKDVTIGDKAKHISIANVGNNPLHDRKIKNVKLYPKAFPKPFDIGFETEEGNRIEISMQQVVYDSWVESKFENINFEGIKIEMIVHDDDIGKSRLSYALFPQRAKNVREALLAVQLFKGLLLGTVKVDGIQLEASVIDTNIDKEQLESNLLFWKNALMIEEKLGINFIPSADFSDEDKTFFAELVECFVNRKYIQWTSPFDHFTVGEVVSHKEMERTIGKKGMKYSFLEESPHCTLLGTDFVLYSYSEMKDFVVKSIKWDETGDGAEIYIDSIEGENWVMTRFFLNAKEKKVVESLMLEGKSVSLPNDLDVTEG